MRPAAATALLGLLLTLTAATFDAEPLYVARHRPHGARRRRPSLWVVLVGARRARRRARWARGARSRSSRSSSTSSSRGGRLPLPSGFIEDDLLPAPAAMASGRRRTEVHISARFARRGRKVLPPPRIVVSDPLGLATRVVTADEPAELLVLPRLEKVVTPPGEGDGSGPGGAPRAPVDRRRGRPRRPAPLPARRGRRRASSGPGWRAAASSWSAACAPTATRARSIVLDPRRPAREEDLDAAVRAAASLCVHLARAGGCALLLPGDRRPTVLESTLIGWPHLHVRLALVDDRSGPERRGAGLAPRARCSTSPPTIRGARRGRWATPSAAGATSSCRAATGCPIAPGARAPSAASAGAARCSPWPAAPATS